MAITDLENTFIMFQETYYETISVIIMTLITCIYEIVSQLTTVIHNCDNNDFDSKRHNQHSNVISNDNSVTL